VLTVIDAVSVAGDRAKQNDDALGWSAGSVWVIDGATDLHDAPRSGAASDAAWFAHQLNADLTAISLREPDPALALKQAVEQTAKAWQMARLRPLEGRWDIPTAAIVMASETPNGLQVQDLGDCRMFVRHPDGRAESFGGTSWTKDDETALAERFTSAAHVGQGHKSPEGQAYLRQARESHNQVDTYAILSVEPELCVARIRHFGLRIDRPCNLLLATDGFAALVDVYKLFTPQTLMEAALKQGLAALTVQLRQFETEGDPLGQKFARWKRSDDATAVLLRLS